MIRKDLLEMIVEYFVHSFDIEMEENDWDLEWFFMKYEEWFGDELGEMFELNDEELEFVRYNWNYICILSKGVVEKRERENC